MMVIPLNIIVNSVPLPIVYYTLHQVCHVFIVFFFPVTNSGTISRNSDNKQVLDKLQVERERGITVKAQTASLFYDYKGETYLLNLIDTPVSPNYLASQSVSQLISPSVSQSVSQSVNQSL